jgi:hypothetical protein
MFHDHRHRQPDGEHQAEREAAGAGDEKKRVSIHVV